MIGIDIVETKRIKKLIKNKKFLKRMFAPEEIKYCETKKNKEQHYSARFAAKEAVWKAFSGKIKISLKDIIIKNIESGKPVVFFNNKKVNNVKIEVSLSHTKDYSVAIAILLDLDKK